MGTGLRTVGCAVITACTGVIAGDTEPGITRDTPPTVAPVTEVQALDALLWRHLGQRRVQAETQRLGGDLAISTEPSRQQSKLILSRISV
jgi:hypothetical protein